MHACTNVYVLMALINSLSIKAVHMKNPHLFDNGAFTRFSCTYSYREMDGQMRSLQSTWSSSHIIFRKLSQVLVDKMSGWFFLLISPTGVNTWSLIAFMGDELKS